MNPPMSDAEFLAVWDRPDVRGVVAALKKQFANIDADELDSLAMYAVWRGMPSWRETVDGRPGQSVTSHVYTAVWRQFAKLGRGQARRTKRECRDLETDVEWVGRDDRSDHSDLVAALRRLPKRLARAVRRRVLEGYSWDELARAENKPRNVVKARVERGLTELYFLLRD